MEKEGMADFYGIQRGVWIEVMGRLRMRKYISQSGEERTATEVIARKVALIPKGEDPMQVQRDW
jgi:single-stranded DNA-binding protein